MKILRWFLTVVFICLPVVIYVMSKNAGFATGSSFLCMALIYIIWNTIIVPANMTTVMETSMFKRVKRVLTPGWHFRIYPFEHILDTLSTLSDFIHFSPVQIRSSEGLPFQAECDWIGVINLRLISRDEWTKKIPVLVDYKNDIIRINLEDTLRLILGKFSAVYLREAKHLRALRNMVRDELHTRLRGQGLETQNLMLKIDLAQDYQSSLLLAHQQQVEIGGEIFELENLHTFVDRVNDPYQREAYLKLQEIRRLGKNGVMLVYPITSGMQNQSVPPKNTSTPPNMSGS